GRGGSTCQARGSASNAAISTSPRSCSPVRRPTDRRRTDRSGRGGDLDPTSIRVSLRGYLKWTVAVCWLPLPKLRRSERHVPAQDESVFQTYEYRPLPGSNFNDEAPAETVSSTVSSGDPVSRVTLWDAGDPVVKIAIPRSPPRLNLTGIAVPALARFRVGGPSTGERKPPNEYGTTVAKFQRLAATVLTVIRIPPPVVSSRFATHVGGMAEPAGPSHFATGVPLRRTTTDNAVCPSGTRLLSMSNTSTSGALSEIATGAE